MVLEGRGRVEDMAGGVFVWDEPVDLGASFLESSFLGGSFLTVVVDGGARDWRFAAASVAVPADFAVPVDVADLVIETALLFEVDVIVDFALEDPAAFGAEEPTRDGLELGIVFLVETEWAVAVVPLVRAVDVPPSLACEDGVLLPLGGLIAFSLVLGTSLTGETL
jgi:hypothetical protein